MGKHFTTTRLVLRKCGVSLRKFLFITLLDWRWVIEMFIPVSLGFAYYYFFFFFLTHISSSEFGSSCLYFTITVATSAESASLSDILLKKVSMDTLFFLMSGVQVTYLCRANSFKYTFYVFTSKRWSRCVEKYQNFFSKMKISYFCFLSEFSFVIFWRPCKISGVKA